AVGARRRGVGAGRPRAGRTGRRGRGRVPHGRLPARASGAHRAAAIGAAVGGDPATAGRSARDRRRASVTPSPRATVLGALDPASALAWDEAIARSPLDRPTLLLCRTQPAVVIGRFQRADWEIDAGACARRGVRVWRRFTGGGAVMIDPGTLCVALAWPA